MVSVDAEPLCDRLVKDVSAIMNSSFWVEALKKAAIVMNAIAETMQEGETKLETKSLAWIITWAVGELETKNKEPK
jgi:hypothetical protein